MEWGLVDFNLVLLPAARNVLAGNDPYLADAGFFSPPWILYAVYPLTFLPDRVATLIWLTMIVVAALWSLKLSARLFDSAGPQLPLPVVALFLLTPYSLQSFFSGQFTAFLMLGVVGSFAWSSATAPFILLSLKPHLGALPSLFLAARLARAREWRSLALGLGMTTALVGSSFLVVPGSLAHFTSGTPRLRSLSMHPEWITTLPRALSELGVGSSAAWAAYGIAIVAATLLLVWRGNLPLIVVGSLLLAPYAREYDYILLTVPALYFVYRGGPRRFAWLLLLLPLHRLIVGDLSWSWLSILGPVAYLALLVPDLDLPHMMRVAPHRGARSPEPVRDDQAADPDPNRDS